MLGDVSPRPPYNRRPWICCFVAAATCGLKKRYTYYMGELGNKLTKLSKLTRPHRIILSRDSLGNMHLMYLLADFTCNRNTPYCPYTRQDLPSQVLQPQQLGVGVSGGAGAAVHGARRLVSNLPAGHVVVQVRLL